MRYILAFLTTTFYYTFIVVLSALGLLLMATVVPGPYKVEVKIVKSGSMEPNIPTGSLIVVRPSPTYAVGEVITFGADTKSHIPTTHRIIDSTSINDQMFYTTKGDANEEEDKERIGQREVVGKVIFSIPKLGYVLDFARTKNGFLALIVGPACFIVLEEITSIFATVRTMRKEKQGQSTAQKKATKADTQTLSKPMILKQTRKRVSVSMDGIITPLNEHMHKRL